MEKIKCKICGSTEVQIKVWIDANTRKKTHRELNDLNKLADEDTWCKDCQKPLGVELEKEE